jgi:pimeloyl-ACP methyl ester carboxylesterase
MNISQLLFLTVFSVAPLGALSQTSMVSKTEVNEQAVKPAGSTLPRSEVTGLIAEEQKIVSPHGIQEMVPVQINGITQWLSIRGSDKRNPILLFLHGGPGAPEIATARLFQRPWEDYFTVVQWDQRGAGKTLVSNNRDALAVSMTIKQMTSDGDEVVRYLQRTYGKKKIFLLGHSWGSVLGVAMAQEHPEWYYAYIGVGQEVNVAKAELVGYHFALEQAHATHNQSAEQELAAIAPYPGPMAALAIQKIGTDRKWITYFGGMEYGRTHVGYIDDMAILSPDYSERDVAAIEEGEGMSTVALAPELLGVDYESITQFKSPIFLFEGRHDWTVPYPLAATWYGRITAPMKQIVWFENSAHMPMLEEPGRFLLHLVTDVRPLADEKNTSHP